MFGIKPAELLKEYIENKNARKQEAREQRLKQRSLKIEDSMSAYVKEEKTKKLKFKEYCCYIQQIILKIRRNLKWMKEKN